MSLKYDQICVFYIQDSLIHIFINTLTELNLRICFIAISRQGSTAAMPNTSDQTSEPTPGHNTYPASRLPTETMGIASSSSKPDYRDNPYSDVYGGTGISGRHVPGKVLRENALPGFLKFLHEIYRILHWQHLTHILSALV